MDIVSQIKTRQKNSGNSNNPNFVSLKYYYFLQFLYFRRRNATIGTTILFNVVLDEILKLCKTLLRIENGMNHFTHWLLGFL